MTGWIVPKHTSVRAGRHWWAAVRWFVWLVPALSAASCLEPERECEDPQATCLFVSQCGPGQGHLSPGMCAGPAGTVCCVPESACPSEDVECCWGSWTSRPDCVDGSFVCQLGARLTPRGTCLTASGCEQSNGRVSTALCCTSSAAFPNTCAIGACGCSLSNSHEVAVCECPAGQCFDGSRCIERG